MTKTEKTKLIDALSEKLKGSNFYLADLGGLTAEQTNRLRRACHEKGVTLSVVKNTLIKKALEKTGNQSFSAIFDTLNGHTSIFFPKTPTDPAKIIKKIRTSLPKPLLKAAYVEECIYKGDDQVQILANLKSKNELIADIILVLKSPAMNVVNALLSGKHKLAGIVKTLSEKENEKSESLISPNG